MSTPLPASLPPRYQIRTLSGPDHAQWACALISHCSFFSSPVWSKIYTTNKTQHCYAMFRAALYQTTHQIDSGHSLGVFDTEYVFERPESVSTNGKLYWDVTDTTVTEEELLQQMDFPLVSIALAYDSFYPLDQAKLQPLFELFPLLPLRNKATERRDARDPATWQATGPGEVLFRGGTATKSGQQGKGFMKKLSLYVMREAADEGFRAIQIANWHDGVSAVWENPPEPFTAEVVVRYKCSEDEDEELRRAFQGSEQVLTKIFVRLRE